MIYIYDRYLLLSKSMREIFKFKKGKDFYRDALEYFEYDPEMLYEKMKEYDIYYMDDDEISYYIEKTF